MEMLLVRGAHAFESSAEPWFYLGLRPMCHGLPHHPLGYVRKIDLAGHNWACCSTGLFCAASQNRQKSAVKSCISKVGAGDEQANCAAKNAPITMAAPAMLRLS
jgi:hypothetical protein